MAPIPYMPPTTPRPTPFIRRRTFLSIPLEIRFIIYEYVFQGQLSDLFLDYVTIPEMDNLDEYFTDKRPKDWTTPQQLLLVCKQVHNELAPSLYRKIRLEFDLDRWISALNKIGPRYGALVQQVEIVHECWDRHRRSGNDGTVWNCLDSPSEGEKYSRLFECLASNNICPGYLRITSYSFLPSTSLGPSNTDDNDNFTENSDADSNQHEHSHSPPYHDQTFINQLSSLCNNIQRIEFDGVFNPLWALGLSQKLDFLIKLENPFENVDAVEPSSAWTLINPKSIDLATEFKGYKTLSSNNRVYIKLPDHMNYARKRGKLIMGKTYAEIEDRVTDYKPRPESFLEHKLKSGKMLPELTLQLIT